MSNIFLLFQTKLLECCDLEHYKITNDSGRSSLVITPFYNQILKSSLNTASFLQRIVLVIIMMASLTLIVDAQTPPCSGTITLTTQAQVDAFDCATFDGDLVIDDDGTDPITSLSIIANAGLTTITGNLDILNCASLTSLSGLEGITDVGGSIVIEDDLMLSDFSALDNLVTVGDQLRIHDTGATDLTFNSLVNVNRIDLRVNNALLDISGFNSVVDIFSLDIWNASSIQDISGFQSLATLGEDLQLNNLNNIPGITGFGSIASIAGELQLGSSPFNNGFPDFGTSYTVEAEVDLYFNCGTCPTITGDLIFGNSATDPITDLSPIANGMISTITGDLIIDDLPGLTSLNGLQSITSIGGGLDINNVGSLMDLSALDNLVDVGSLLWIRNTAATDFSFDALQTVGTTILLNNNQDLEDISGFNALTSVGGIWEVSFNISLTDISGFMSLVTVNGRFSLNGLNVLSGISGLDDLSQIGGDLILASSSSILEFPVIGTNLNDEQSLAI